jgi:hypothetical protein
MPWSATNDSSPQEMAFRKKVLLRKYKILCPENIFDDLVHSISHLLLKHHLKVEAIKRCGNVLKNKFG